MNYQKKCLGWVMRAISEGFFSDEVSRVAQLSPSLSNCSEIAANEKMLNILEALPKDPMQFPLGERGLEMFYELCDLCDKQIEENV